MVVINISTDKKQAKKTYTMPREREREKSPNRATVFYYFIFITSSCRWHAKIPSLLPYSIGQWKRGQHKSVCDGENHWGLTTPTWYVVEPRHFDSTPELLRASPSVSVCSVGPEGCPGGYISVLEALHTFLGLQTKARVWETNLIVILHREKKQSCRVDMMTRLEGPQVKNEILKIIKD